MSEASSFERSEKLTVGGFGGAVSPPTGFEEDSHKNLRFGNSHRQYSHGKLALKQITIFYFFEIRNFLQMKKKSFSKNRI